MLNKETIAVSIKLFVITAIAALCLAVVNMITVPIIAENSAKADTEALQAALPTAEEFKKADFSQEDIPVGNSNGVRVESINIGLSSGNGVGYVVTAISSEGYGGDIRVLIGLDNSVNVSCVKVLQSSETPGLGANTSKPDFLNQYIGKNEPLTVIKNSVPDNAEVAAVSGATISSKAVTNCVNTAIELVHSKIKKGYSSSTAAAVNEKLEETKRETELQMKNDIASTTSEGGAE